MSDLNELIQTLKAEAIANKISPNEAAYWRWVCRQYSTNFFTPLKEVLEMDPEHVILNVFEQQLEDLDPEEHIEELMRKIYAIEDPNYEADQEKDLQDFIAMAEEEEEERLSKGRPVHWQEFDEPTLQTKTVPKEEFKKEGYVNLSYLEDSDDEK